MKCSLWLSHFSIQQGAHIEPFFCQATVSQGLSAAEILRPSYFYTTQGSSNRQPLDGDSPSEPRVLSPHPPIGAYHNIHTTSFPTTETTNTTGSTGSSGQSSRISLSALSPLESGSTECHLVCKPKGVLNLSTIGILGQMVLCGGCPVYGRIFSNIPGLYPLDVSSILSCHHQRCLQTLPDDPWEANWPPVGNRPCKIRCLQNPHYLLLCPPL